MYKLVYSKEYGQFRGAPYAKWRSFRASENARAPSRLIPKHTRVEAIADGQKSHWQTVGEHTLPALCIKRCRLEQHNHTATLVLEITLSDAQSMMTSPIDIAFFCPPGQAIVSP